MNVFMVIDNKNNFTVSSVFVATHKSLLEQQKSKMMQMFSKLPNST